MHGLDQFGNRYRARYARQYMPRIDMVDADVVKMEKKRTKRNNLHVMFQRGYNGDRRREKAKVMIGMQ
jgi:hypothetical protein